VKCPLCQPNGDCVKNLCAWWMSFSEACAIHTIAELAQDTLVDKFEAEQQRLESLKIKAPDVRRISYE
jgi:hypothetical protein